MIKINQRSKEVTINIHIYIYNFKSGCIVSKVNTNYERIDSKGWGVVSNTWPMNPRDTFLPRTTASMSTIRPRSVRKKNDSDIMERWNTPVTMVSRSEHLHMISVYIANVANTYLSNKNVYSSVFQFYKHYQKDCCHIDPGSTIMWLVVMMGMRWSDEAVVPMPVLEMDMLNQTLNKHSQVMGNERLRHLKKVLLYNWWNIDLNSVSCVYSRGCHDMQRYVLDVSK